MDERIFRGEREEHTIFRTKQLLTQSQLQQLKVRVNLTRVKGCDRSIQWSDDRMHCSELVRKLYDSEGVQRIEPGKMKGHHGMTTKASQMIKERWGNNEFYNELLVAPSDISESP